MKFSLLKTLIFLNIGLTFLLSICFLIMFETYLDVDNIIDTRITTYILTSNGGRNTQMLLNYINNAIVYNDNNHKSDNSLTREMYYKEKYISVLNDFMANGNSMLVLVLEDDVVPIYTKSVFLYHLAFHTLALFSNDLVNYDCSKRGFLLSTGSSDNKSLCRIFSKETLREQISCLTSLDEPIDIMIGYCQEKLGIQQRRLLIVNHTGMKSTLGH